MTQGTTTAYKVNNHFTIVNNKKIIIILLCRHLSDDIKAKRKCDATFPTSENKRYITISVNFVIVRIDSMYSPSKHTEFAVLVSVPQVNLVKMLQINCPVTIQVSQ